MAHFDTEYQRLETSYNDSPPGEENLLVHVPEGTKCKLGGSIFRKDTFKKIFADIWKTGTKEVGGHPCPW